MRRALVLGLGTTGTAVVTALLARGVDVDSYVDAADQPAPAVPDDLDAEGRHLDRPSAAEVDAGVPSPGFPPTHPVLAAALDRGVPVWSEPELAWRLNEGRTRVVGVTGTNGKTTTTEMVAACLDAPAAGNIGTPLVTLLAAADPPPLVVAELSSFQLHLTSTLRCEVGVLLNVADDHLDWHGDAAAYRAAKARLWAAQRPDDTVVALVDDPGVRATLAEHPPPGRLVEAAPGDGVVDPARIAAPGPHNLANATAAAHAALAAGATPDAVAAALARVRPGAHRLEVVAERGGVTWVDDSKATNPHAAAAALASFERILWIAGGLDKGMDFAALGPAAAGRVRHALLIGRCAEAIAAVTRAAGVPTEVAGTLDAAVARAAELAEPGDTVLLAPAAASFDQFRDYADRGTTFRRLVGSLP